MTIMSVCLHGQRGKHYWVRLNLMLRLFCNAVSRFDPGCSSAEKDFFRRLALANSDLLFIT